MYGNIFPSLTAILIILGLAGLGIWKFIDLLGWLFSHLAWV